MGQKATSLISEEMLEEYVELTYLNRTEILNLMKIFLQFGAKDLQKNFQHRFPVEIIKEHFPQLKFNPFRDRIYELFSSEQDVCFSFEDILDLYSVFSENCPSKVKATWAFRIFDFDNNGSIDETDLMKIVDRLTQGLKRTRVLPIEDKKHISRLLLKHMDIECNGNIGQLEFEHAVGKMMEFSHAFSFRV